MVDRQLRRPGPSWLTEVPEVRWAAACLACFALAGVLLGAGVAPVGSAIALAACYAAGGWQPAWDGMRELRHGRLDVDVLMVLAALAAAGVGQAVDGGLLIVIFATSGALEAVATRRTETSVRHLVDLAPDRATVRSAGGDERTVAAGDLVPGDIVVIRPGERIPADGTVVEGASDVDQAGVTGEAVPVAKQAGAEVWAGSLNGLGHLEVHVDRPASASAVARIVALVEAASATKADTQLLIEKVEQRYSVGMVAVTAALATVPLALGHPFTPTLLRAMTFMIVASPCAVVLATMPPLLSAIATAGRHGVLVRSAVVMERLGGTTRVAFDKTGTLTTGRLRVTDVVPLAPGVGATDVLRRAGAAEDPSEHPLGRAIAAAARADGAALPRASEFTAVPGVGVAATVEGHRIRVRRPLDGEDALLPAGGGARGSTVVVIEVDGLPSGLILLADEARRDAGAAVDRLRDLTPLPTVLLTGDQPGAATSLAAHVGVTEVHAGLLPDEKLGRVQALQAGGEHVLFVGDGVNDAPAMAAAHLGMAMGRTGADVTLDVADAVIVGDGLAAVPAAVELSRRAARLVRQNLLLAAIVMAGLVVWDLAGHLPLPLGVAGHEGSTVVIGLNGLRLLRHRSWPDPGPSAEA